MDDEKAPEDQVLEAADDVIETELDRLIVYGAIAAVVVFAIAFAMGWIGKTASGAKAKS